MGVRRRGAPASDAIALLESFPREDFYVIEDDDGEKSYSYAARPLVTLGADRIAPLAPLASPWQRLGESLLSPSYRSALGELIGQPLDEALMEASMWRWDTDAQLGPHRDMAEKIVTQVFYLSAGWDPAWGGCLRILRSCADEDVAAELPPINGTSSVLVRSERSWHSVSPVTGAACEPRRSIIVTWFRPDSTSPVWQVGEQGSIECVAAGSRPERPRALAHAALGNGRSRGAAHVAPAAGEERPGGTVPRLAHSPARRGGQPASRARPEVSGLRAMRARTAKGPPRTRVAMVGTFDIANFGDLLLPLIAARELRERLGGDFEPTLYSYRPMSADHWRLEVRPLAQLPHEIDHFGLLLVGGGQIVRFDRAFPAGYLPSDPSVHHPLGLWLTPMLLAVAAAVPVAWNATGVAADIPDWLAAPIAAAVEASSHVSVRDEISAQMLSTLVPDAPVRVVPDTGFGIGRLLDAKPSQELEELVARLGGERGYVVVKPSAELRDVAGAVRGVLAAARERGLAVVELPFSPSHGDRTGTLPGLGETVSPPDWPGPRLIAEILAGAEAVIAQSFHAGAVATASGVPLYRPPSPPGWKYEALEGHEGVHLLREGSGDGPGSGSYEDFGRRSPAATVRERIAQLSAHWDAVAATARAERRRDAPLTPAALGLIAALPHQLHAHEELLQERSAERERVIAERLHAAEARLAASEAAAAARIENLRSASTALLAQKEDLTTWVARLTDERTEAAARTAALDEVRKPQDRAPRLLLTRPLLWLRRWRGRQTA